MGDIEMHDISYGHIMHDGYKFFLSPEMSEWQCQLFGLESQCVLRPLKNQEPNWFWRQMQYLIFGNKWIREKK